MTTKNIGVPIDAETGVVAIDRPNSIMAFDADGQPVLLGPFNNGVAGWDGNGVPIAKAGGGGGEGDIANSGTDIVQTDNFTYIATGRTLVLSDAREYVVNLTGSNNTTLPLTIDATALPHLGEEGYQQEIILTLNFNAMANNQVAAVTLTNVNSGALTLSWARETNSVSLILRKDDNTTADGNWTIMGLNERFNSPYLARTVGAYSNSGQIIAADTFVYDATFTGAYSGATIDVRLYAARSMRYSLFVRLKNGSTASKTAALSIYISGAYSTTIARPVLAAGETKAYQLIINPDRTYTLLEVDPVSLAVISPKPAIEARYQINVNKAGDWPINIQPTVYDYHIKYGTTATANIILNGSTVGIAQNLDFNLIFQSAYNNPGTVFSIYHTNTNAANLIMTYSTVRDHASGPNHKVIRISRKLRDDGVGTDWKGYVFSGASGAPVGLVGSAVAKSAVFDMGASGSSDNESTIYLTDEGVLNATVSYSNGGQFINYVDISQHPYYNKTDNELVAVFSYKNIMERTANIRLPQFKGITPYKFIPFGCGTTLAADAIPLRFKARCLDNTVAQGNWEVLEWIGGTSDYFEYTISASQINASGLNMPVTDKVKGLIVDTENSADTVINLACPYDNMYIPRFLVELTNNHGDDTDWATAINYFNGEGNYTTTALVSDITIPDGQTRRYLFKHENGVWSVLSEGGSGVDTTIINLGERSGSVPVTLGDSVYYNLVTTGGANVELDKSAWDLSKHHKVYFKLWANTATTRGVISFYDGPAATANEIQPHNIYIEGGQEIIVCLEYYLNGWHLSYIYDDFFRAGEGSTNIFKYTETTDANEGSTTVILNRHAAPIALCELGTTNTVSNVGVSSSSVIDYGSTLLEQGVSFKLILKNTSAVDKTVKLKNYGGDSAVFGTLNLPAGATRIVTTTYAWGNWYVEYSSPSPAVTYTGASTDTAPTTMADGDIWITD